MSITERSTGNYDAEEVDEVPAEAENEQPMSPTMIGGSYDLAPSTVTLSGLLNAIDGVSSQVCRILTLSTKMIDVARF